MKETMMNEKESQDEKRVSKNRIVTLGDLENFKMQLIATMRELIVQAQGAAAEK